LFNLCWYLNINKQRNDCTQAYLWHKILAIIIQANLKWNTHIVQLKNKISKSIGIIDKAKSLLATAHLNMLYLSLIEPYLTYCCIVWASPMKTTSLDVLYKLQKRAARIIMFVHHLAHAEPIFRKLNIFNIYDLYKCQILIYVYKCYNNLLPPICINYFTLTKDVHHSLLNS